MTIRPEHTQPILQGVLRALFLSILVIMPRLTAQIRFDENGQSAGIHTTFKAFGVSVNDYDLDGWDDILFVGTSGVALFRNNTDGTFSDATAPAGLSYSAAFVVGIWADMDNDGDADLFLGRRDTSAGNKVLRNDGGTFVDISSSAGIDTLVSIGSAAAGDYDNDGLVDLYLSTRGGYDQLYRNGTSAAGISFTNVSEISGMKGTSYSIGMQPTWIDYDRDGDLDMFVVHDGFELSRLHQNRGILPFPNLAGPFGIADVGAGNSMGVSWGDIDNDGWEDVYVSRIDSGGLYRNIGGNRFQDIAGASGADSNGMSWGVVIGDLDNDGWQDIALVNTSSFGGNHPASILYRNLGDGTFTEIGESSGFSTIQDFYGLASGDFDNDGRVDLVGASYAPAGQNRLWMNRTISGNRWVRVRLTGRGGVNSMGIGARVRVVAGDSAFVRTLFAGSSYCSQVSPVLHFGLGPAATIDTLEILWKGDHKETLTGLATDSVYSIVRSQTTTVGGTNDTRDIPQGLKLSEAFPNPFNSTTRLVLRVGTAGSVRVSLYDVLGRRVRVILKQWMSWGEHSLTIDADGLGSGTYVVLVENGSGITAKPLLLLR